MSGGRPDRGKGLAWLLGGVAMGAATGVVAVLGAVALVRGDAPTRALPPPSFVEEEALDPPHIYDGEFEFFVGGGVAVFDCDADSRPDLYLAGGVNPAGLYRNHSETGGDLRFSPVEVDAAELTGVTGAYPLDVDSDGIVDLSVLRVGPNVMLRGRGDCRFEVAEAWGVDGGDEWTAGFSAAWEEGRSLPTLAFANYLQRDRSGCADHHLFRPEGGNYGQATLLSPGYCALSALFSDWSRSGRRDLRLTNDRHYYRDGTEQLWRLDPAAPPRLYREEEGWRHMQIWGMGIASHDVTGDGLPEIYLTSQGDNKLQTLEEGPERPEYEDIALQTGVNAHRPVVGDDTRPSTAWHAEFDDVNNDGFVDLFVTKGNVEAMPEFAAEDPNNLLLGTPDGTFEEAAQEAGLLDTSRSRGGAVTDLNRDGRLDVVVVERRRPVRLWRNTSDHTGNWLAVSPRQDAPNRDAVGAWIQVRLGAHVMEREVTVGGGHAGGELGPVPFGLGSASKADVRIQWPGGAWSDWRRFEANQTVTVTP